MNVHNLFEDLVTKEVNILYDKVRDGGTNWLSCDCENCRLDTICYVLNRIPPKYIVSGRGVTHSADYFSNFQAQADIEALAMEGMRIVSSTKRPFHSSEKHAKKVPLEFKPAFNFFTFTGNVLDGTTFEPLSNVTLLLKLDGKPVEMIDNSWSNPVSTCKSTKGNFAFLVKPIPAEKEGISKKFNFSLEVSAADYEDLSYHFSVPVTSEGQTKFELDSSFAFKVQDLLLFKK